MENRDCTARDWHYLIEIQHCAAHVQVSGLIPRYLYAKARQSCGNPDGKQAMKTWYLKSEAYKSNPSFVILSASGKIGAGGSPCPYTIFEIVLFVC